MDIEFISSKALSKEQDKVDYILKTLNKSEKVLVLQYTLTPFEEKRLIQETMVKIDDKFNGIEVSTLKDDQKNDWKAKVMEMLGVKSNGLTIVGPSSIVKKIKKNPDIVRMSIGESPS